MKIRIKGLKLLYEKDDPSHLPPEMLTRIRAVLQVLGEAERPGNLAISGYRLLPLHGNMSGT